MIKNIEDLRQQRILLLYESTEAKTQFVKQSIQKRLKTINAKLYKETKNAIYL
jgi:hypothetical protein